MDLVISLRRKPTIKKPRLIDVSQGFLFYRIANYASTTGANFRQAFGFGLGFPFQL